MKITKVDLEVTRRTTFELEGMEPYLPPYFRTPIRPHRVQVVIQGNSAPHLKVWGFRVKKDGTDSANPADFHLSQWERKVWPAWAEELAQKALDLMVEAEELTQKALGLMVEEGVQGHE